MAIGKVKWYNPSKGYGFIHPDNGKKDVFIHVSALEKAGIPILNDGDGIEYELMTNNGKVSAVNIKKLD